MMNVMEWIFINADENLTTRLAFFNSVNFEEEEEEEEETTSSSSSAGSEEEEEKTSCSH
jgi:hypothetical protein